MPAPVDHTHIYVKDHYETAKWFQKILGFEIVKKYESWADGGPLSISADSGATKIALFKKENLSPSDLNRNHEVAFRLTTDEFLEFLENAKAMDVRNSEGNILSKKDIVDHELAFSIYFLDPDENRYEVTCYEVDKIKERL